MRWKAFTFASLSLIVGLALGNKFPDIDQDTALLVHRSVFMHGPLLPFLLFLVASGIRFAPLRLFAMGFSLGVAVHLSFDLFPKAWQGFALIHVPVIGWTYPLVSWVWIALSIILCLYMALGLARNGVQGTALVFGVPGMFGYAALNEDAVWGPLLSLIAATLIGLVVLLWRRSGKDQGPYKGEW